MEPWTQHLLFFLLGVLVTGAGGGLSVGRTLARHDVRLEHLEASVKHIVDLLEKE